MDKMLAGIAWKYILSASSDEEATVIINWIKHFAEQAAEKALARSFGGHVRRQIYTVYQSTIYKDYLPVWS